MAINYTIRADVVDIRYDKPRTGDTFLVDTNVWYWVAYNRANLSSRPPLYYQKTRYPAYVQKALVAGSRLLQSGLSLAELAHLIEVNERELFIGSNPPIPPKEYRHNYPGARAKVVTEVQFVWNQVKTYAESLDLFLDETTTDEVLVKFSTQPLDGYDLLILESMSRAGVDRVITDDGDFCTVPGIQLFTANGNVIAAAQNQGKLINR